MVTSPRISIENREILRASVNTMSSMSMPQGTGPIRLITVAPGHFHAALVQKQMLPSIDRRSSVYGSLDADLIAHLERIAAFNNRVEEPTAWEVEMYAGVDYLERTWKDRRGNTVILSGRNRPKIDLIQAAVANGLHVLADKPWIVEAADYAKLTAVMTEADRRGVLVWDAMTERHEVTTKLQRELILDSDLFGEWQTGALDRPALEFESLHFLKKVVSGRPLKRPWWWFDPSISGEAIADVGVHLADLALWLVSPNQSVDVRRDLAILDANRWPLNLSRTQFSEITGLVDYPAELSPYVAKGLLSYAGNNSVSFTLRGIHVKLTARWEYDSPGGDAHQALARGTRAAVQVRQTPGLQPEVFVLATDPRGHAALVVLLNRKCDEWQTTYPGMTIEDRATEVRLVIPAALRTSHEEHFAEVMADFAQYFHMPLAVPDCERANSSAKYFITTGAVQFGRDKSCVP